MKGAGMKVYVLEVGCYENSHIVGIYETPEAAMAAHSPKRPAGRKGVLDHSHGSRAGELWSYEWTEDEHGWSFGADWDDAADITAYEVQSAVFVSGQEEPK